MALSVAAATRNAEVNAATALLNNGTIVIYSGSVPATADTALGAQVVLATCTYGATAFGAASGGSATANAIAGANAVATGTASFFRSFKVDATTVVLQGAVGTSGAELNINSTAIQNGAAVAVTSQTYARP